MRGWLCDVDVPVCVTEERWWRWWRWWEGEVHPPLRVLPVLSDPPPMFLYFLLHIERERERERYREDGF